MGEATTDPRSRDLPVADIIGWDVRTWSKAVDHWSAVLPPGGPVLRCLEIGAGPGGPSLWLALRGHDVTCSNFENTRDQAGPLHERYGVDTITYENIDANAIGYDAEFDLIIFKSVLGGAGSSAAQQRDIVAGMHRALKPGGRLLFAENLRSTWLHRIVRAVAYRFRGTSWRYLTRRELDDMLGVFESHDLRTTGFLALFGMTEAQRRRLAAADDAVFNRVPASWRYVAFGSATKAS